MKESVRLLARYCAAEDSGFGDGRITRGKEAMYGIVKDDFKKERKRNRGKLSAVIENACEVYEQEWFTEMRRLRGVKKGK